MHRTRCNTTVAAKKGGSAPVADDQPSQREPPPPRTPRDQKLTAPEVLERGASEHPYPGEFQQTLISSFTLAGVGLHTGDTAIVRVRPAFANEGRYFVIVPEGTNVDVLDTEEVPSVQLEEGGQAPLDPELEEAKLALFKEYLLAQEDDGFVGTFPQYLQSIDAQMLGAAWEAGDNVSARQWDHGDPEPIVPRGPDEATVSATIDDVTLPSALTIALGDGNGVTVVGAEHILAALEAGGVDNARIEIEGGVELPSLDGSAQGWAMHVQFSGVRPAPLPGSDDLVPRLAARLSTPFTVVGDDRPGSSVSFIPEDNVRLTVGIDEHQDSKIVGKQWKSWALYEDLPFRFELGGARKWVPSPTHLQVYSEQGFFKGFTEGTLMIGYGDRWYDPSLLRHVRDEAARADMVTLLGALALAARPGHSGLPFGHVIAHKATPQLMVDFVRELARRVAAEDPEAVWVRAWDVTLNVDYFGVEPPPEGAVPPVDPTPDLGDEQGEQKA